MSWLLIVILIALLFFGLIGRHQGFLRILLAIVEFIIMLTFASWAASVVNILTEGLTFLIAFVLAAVILRLVTSVLRLFARLPVINGIDRFLGFFAGLFFGLIVIWFFFCIVQAAAFTQFGATMLSLISQSRFLTWLYQNNLVSMFAALFL